ncbi:MAG: hypothetical protein RLZZ290_717 [Pseudomonadota bacterium]|jgi:sulfur-oxidizing protein SoxY
MNPEIPLSPQAKALIQSLTKGAPLRELGVTLEVPPLVENGNLVEVTVQAESPMTAAQHVKAMHLVSGTNPSAQVLSVQLTPDNGAARIRTRMRMADSQQVIALVQDADNTWRIARRQSLVTLSACLEGLI